jgi:3-deoxy-D-manno-octulosonic acid (KDO) 8-phosphate synthase
MWGTSQLTRNIERQVELPYKTSFPKANRSHQAVQQELEQVYQFYNMQVGHNF